MKLHREEREFESSGLNNEHRQFGIRQTAKMFRILSDQMYADKPAAIIRELGCNAWDSHVAAGVEDTPFRVHLPTSLEPWLEVEDYGIGLCHDDVMSLYTTYGDSTKEDSNLFIGALGLGSKSPFSYTDNFTVRVNYNREQRLYNAYINESGEPMITMVGSPGDTDEPNGILIKVPTKSNDVGDFESAAAKYYKYLPTLPEVNGKVKELIEDAAGIKPTLEGANWKYYVSGMEPSGIYNYRIKEHLTAIMGNVPYPITIESIKSAVTTEDYDKFIRPLANRNVTFTFKLGELDVAASRESLSYDETTIVNIVSAFKAMQNEVADIIIGNIKEAKTKWEAALKLSDYSDMISLIGNKEAIKWNGESIDSSWVININDLTEASPELKVYTINNYVWKKKNISNLKELSARQQQETEYSDGNMYYRDEDIPVGVTATTTKYRCVNIKPDDELIFVRLPESTVVRMPSRICRGMKKYKENASLVSTDMAARYKYSVILIAGGTNTDQQEILKRAGYPPVVHKFNDIFPDYVPAKKTKKGTVATGKQSCKQYKGGYSWGSGAANWEDIEVDLDNSKGYYVDLRKNCAWIVDGDRLVESYELNQIVDQAINSGILANRGQVYGWNGATTNLMKGHSNFLPLFEYLYEEATKKVNALNVKSFMHAKSMYEEYNNNKVIYEVLHKYSSKILKSERDEICKLMTIPKPSDDIQVLGDFLAKVAGLLGKEYTLDTTEVKVYNSSILSRYPLLSAMLELTSHRIYYGNTERANSIDDTIRTYAAGIEDYIAMVNKEINLND